MGAIDSTYPREFGIFYDSLLAILPAGLKR